MKPFTVILYVGIAALLCPRGALADSYVTVESKTICVGATDQTVGIYTANDLELSAMVLPIELRSVSGGAGFTRPYLVSVTGRVGAGGLEDFATRLYSDAPAANTCSGPVSHTWASSQFVFNGLHAFLYAGLVTLSPPLAPGTDPPGEPSFVLTFDANMHAGVIDIDTCCWAPASHLLFVDAAENPILPSFTMGTITLACECDCIGDQSCDAVFDVLDVVMAVDVAFRDGADITEPLCPINSTDADCDGDTDVLDIVHIVNVAFRGADPATEFCDPCAP